MEKNVGGMDRWVRWGLGAGLLIWGFRKRGLMRMIGFSAAASLLGTASFSRCFMNQLLGINTASKEPKVAGKPLVDVTSEESFPASDAPAWAASR